MINYVSDGICRLPFHPLGDVGVGVQREICAAVTKRVGESFHVHAVLQGSVAKDG